MKPIILSIKEARESFAEIVEKAALTDQEYIITKFGKPKIRISKSYDILKEITKKEKIKALQELRKDWKDKFNEKTGAEWQDEIRNKNFNRYGKIFDR